jgi:stage II sporulation protein P
MQQIADKMEELYPGLLRRVSVQAGRYNQHIFEHAILVEMGTTENTIDEVEYSAQLLGDVLSEVLKNAAE